MYTNELINLLQTFSNKELMWFGKFLSSPFFNNRKRAIKLFQVLRKFHPSFENKNFTKINIFKLTFGSAKYNDSTFRNLMSDLLQLALQYLQQEGLSKREIDNSFYITTELFNRECFTLFRKIMTQNKRLLESKVTYNSDYFFNSYKIDTDSFNVNLLTQKVLKKSYVISESERLIEGIANVLNYFVIETIKHNDNLLEYSRSYNVHKNIETVSAFLEIFNFDKVILYIKKNSNVKVPIVELYYNLLKAFTNFDDEKFYFEFKKSLFECSENLGMGENNFLHLRLIAYCILKINYGMNSSLNLYNEIFELHKIYIENGYYRTEGSKYLPFDMYRNVLLNCISVKNLKYMEEFVRTYSKKLLPGHIVSIENYSFALLNFEKENFNKALSYINKIKFDEFVYKLDMKNLQLKISYELEQFESAISIIDTYKHFLKNNVLLTESRRVLHNNFVNYTNNLIQYKAGSKKINLSYILHRIENSKNIFDKVWLVDKINQLVV